MEQGFEHVHLRTGELCWVLLAGVMPLWKVSIHEVLLWALTWSTPCTDAPVPYRIRWKKQMWRCHSVLEAGNRERGKRRCNFSRMICTKGANYSAFLQHKCTTQGKQPRLAKRGVPRTLVISCSSLADEGTWGGGSCPAPAPAPHCRSVHAPAGCCHRHSSGAQGDPGLSKHAWNHDFAHESRPDAIKDAWGLNQR